MTVNFPQGTGMDQNVRRDYFVVYNNFIKRMFRSLIQFSNPC